ncbi:hypothetical protein FB451DRAFT_1190785 [Mycena latifolia]|nr:hypothetical protein FB451DRAFT_1190785 [Mycena latifolia]
MDERPRRARGHAKNAQTERISDALNMQREGKRENHRQQRHCPANTYILMTAAELQRVTKDVRPLQPRLRPGSSEGARGWSWRRAQKRKGEERDRERAETPRNGYWSLSVALRIAGITAQAVTSRERPCSGGRASVSGHGFGQCHGGGRFSRADRITRSPDCSGTIRS